MQLAFHALLLAVGAAGAHGLLLTSRPNTTAAANLVCDLQGLAGAAISYADTDEFDAVTSEPASVEEKQKNLQDAITEYKQKRVQYKLAQAKLMGAMESFLKVPQMDDVAAVKLLEEKERSSEALIVFYAPWCPHCQTFVLHDKKGVPTNAPLEVFSQELAKEDATKNVSVFRYDMSKHGQGLPKDFPVQGIPAVFWVGKTGSPTPYEGNPHDTVALKAFVEGKMAH